MTDPKGLPAVGAQTFSPQEDEAPLTQEEFERIVEKISELARPEIDRAFRIEAILNEMKENKTYLAEWDAAQTQQEKEAVDRKFRRGLYAEDDDDDIPLFLI